MSDSAWQERQREAADERAIEIYLLRDDFPEPYPDREFWHYPEGWREL